MMKIIYFALFLIVCSVAAVAGEPSVWSVNSRAEVLRGDANGVSIDQSGTISLAPKLTEVFKTEQSYIWSSAVDAVGNVYLGTGGDGKVFRVDQAGKGSLFTDLIEMNVTALAMGSGGELFAGTSPDGKVYRIDAGGTASVYFNPREKYIWSLVVLSDGSLGVGTGDGGKIYRVSAANAAPESSMLFDTSETHIISLAADKHGNLFAGTDSNGLVMRFGPDGRPFGLLDSPLREIHELAIGPDGSLYALVLGESASVPKPPEATAVPAAAATPASKVVSVGKPGAVVVPEAAAKSKYDLTGARSAIYRIMPDGSAHILWTSTTAAGFSLYAHPAGGGVLLGTSDKGRIYNIENDGRETLLLQSDANQISTIRSAGEGLIATSSNQGALYGFGTSASAEGTYVSAVLDAKGTAAWGRLWWRSTGSVTLQTRSGNTEVPNETWSAWSAPLADQRGSKAASPKARYLQWRAVLRSSTVAATLNDVNLAFITRNIAPEVLSIQVLPTGVGLLANPPVQIDPNIALSGLDPVTFGIPSAVVPPRRVYLRGATSLQWTAEDRNGDKMVYDVLYREAGQGSFRALRENLTDTFIAIDGQSLADGRYVFKIVARDTPSNPVAQSLTGDKLTEPVDIDNTPPVASFTGPSQGSNAVARVFFDAVDASSYLTRAEYSVNGGEWFTVYPDDGISDSPRERYTVEIPTDEPGEFAITIRVFDVNGNSGNARAVVKK